MSRTFFHLLSLFFTFFHCYCSAVGFVGWRQSSQEDFLTGAFSGSDASLSSGNIVLSKSEQQSTLTITLPKVSSHASSVWDPVRNVAYIFGGLDADETAVADIVRFDPTSGKATLMGVSLPSGRASSSAVWDSTANVAYIFGGYNNINELAAVVKYDPATNTVSTISATLPFARQLTSAVWDPVNRAAYVFGGLIGNSLINQVVKFDPNAGTPMSVVTAPLPTARRYTSAVWDTSRNVAYVFGGFGGGTYLDTVVRFNPATGQVESLSVVLPSPRQATSALWDDVKGAAYVFGGLNAGGVLNAVVKFDPSLATAATLDVTLPRARNDSSAVWNASNKIGYVFGGQGADRYGDIVQIGPGFISSGAYISAAKNRLEDGSVGTWARLIWNPLTQPTGTTLKVQLASSKNSSGPWDYVGPNGSSSSFYTEASGASVWSGHAADTYLRYRATFSSISALLTSTLSDMVVSYTSSTSLSAQPSGSSKAKPGSEVSISGTVPLISPNPTVTVALVDQNARVIADGVGSHTVTAASDGTVSGTVVLGAMSLKRGDARSVVVQVTVTETNSQRSSTLSSGAMTLEGSRASFKAYNNRFDPNSGGNASLRVELTKSGRVIVRVMAQTGELVATVWDGDLSAGVHLFDWAGNNGSGEMVASGIYLVNAVGPDFNVTDKIAIIKKK